MCPVAITLAPAMRPGEVPPGLLCFSFAGGSSQGAGLPVKCSEMVIMQHKNGMALNAVPRGCVEHHATCQDRTCTLHGTHRGVASDRHGGSLRLHAGSQPTPFSRQAHRSEGEDRGRGNPADAWAAAGGAGATALSATSLMLHGSTIPNDMA